MLKNKHHNTTGYQYSYRKMLKSLIGIIIIKEKKFVSLQIFFTP